MGITELLDGMCELNDYSISVLLWQRVTQISTLLLSMNRVGCYRDTKYITSIS